MNKQKLLSFVFLLFMGGISFAQTLPPNASPNPYGQGWICDRGFYKADQHCIKVQPPANASINFLGNGWDCNKGFYKSGESCLEVKIPPNAGLNYLGDGWDCNKGFFKSGNLCFKVKVPENASLDFLGNGWDCNKGYSKAGDRCVKILLPKNARLNYLGNGWECIAGYKKTGDSCVLMTAGEIQSQKKIETAIRAEMQRRKTQGVSGEDCEVEYKTNAEVCVTVTDTGLDCNESYDGESYRDCDMSVSYEVETNYGGGAYLDVDVTCLAEINYQGRQIYSTRSDSLSEDGSHSLYAHGSESETLDFNFTFGSYQEVTSVKISSVECEVNSIDLY